MKHPSIGFIQVCFGEFTDCVERHLESAMKFLCWNEEQIFIDGMWSNKGKVADCMSVEMQTCQVV